MDTRPLPFLIAIIILLLAGGALWYVLTLSPSEGVPGTATSTPSGAIKAHVEDSGDVYQIDVYYPTETPLLISAGTSANASAVFAMKTFAETEAVRFKDNSIADLTPDDIRIQELGGERKYTLEADYDVYTSDVAVSYVYHMYVDTMGAHPNAYYRTFTFDLLTGEELHIGDLFATPDFLEVLSNESRTRLVPQIAKAYEVPEAELDRSMVDAGTTPFSDNFQNFYFEGDALVLLFPPYQVGPWALGTQEVSIPRSDLGNTLELRYR
jgi:hypothetical protein